MKRAKISILTSLGLAAIIGLTSTPSATANDDTPGVRKQCEAFVAGWNGHDAKAMASVFTADGDMINPAGHLLQGRAAIEKALAEEHGAKGPMRESKLEVKEEPVRFITPDVAVSDALVVVTGAYAPDGTKAGPITLVITNVWKKTGGAWWIAASRARIKQGESSPG